MQIPQTQNQSRQMHSPPDHHQPLIVESAHQLDGYQLCTLGLHNSAAAAPAPDVEMLDRKRFVQRLKPS